MKEILKQYAAEIIATIALIQPWAICLWRRLFQRGYVEIYETSKIEIGYGGTLGPTVGLFGTLRTIHNDLFVRNIHITVTRLKDGATHSLQWGFFRSGATTSSGKRDVSLELPSGFMLTTIQPYRYNIQFHDSEAQTEFQPHQLSIKQSWFEKISEINPQTWSMLRPEALMEQIHGEFVRSSTCMEAAVAFDRSCYWEPGRYSLRIQIRTERPSATFGKSWFFELSTTDSQNLRGNIPKSIRELCGLAPGEYFFAFPAYQQE